MADDDPRTPKKVGAGELRRKTTKPPRKTNVQGFPERMEAFFTREFIEKLLPEKTKTKPQTDSISGDYFVPVT